MTPRPFPAQGQAFLGIHATKAFFADLPAFALQQDAQPTIPEPHARLRQLAHPLPQGEERILPAHVVRRRSRRSKHATGTARADGVAAHQVVHDFALLDGLQNFF
jgi:hypothetical protein